MENKLKEEIDHLNKIGAEVMEMNLNQWTKGYYRFGIFYCLFSEWSPATDINQFMLVLSEMRKRGWKFIIFLYHPNKVMVDMWRTFSRTSVDAEAPVDQPALAGMRCISRCIKNNP